MNIQVTSTASDVTLRPTDHADLDFLFQFQLNKEARYLAAFIGEDSMDKAAYLKKYTRLLSDPTVNNQTIMLANTIIGSVASFVQDGNRELTYWIDRNHWGKGVATAALQQFLRTELFRPIYGRVACDNIGSQKVLKRCGFLKIGTANDYAQARNSVIEEYIYALGGAKG